MTFTRTTVDRGSSAERIGAARILAALIVLPAAWLTLDAVEHPAVQLILHATGGRPQGDVLTLHRYIAIGLVRMLWWLAAALIVARMTLRQPTELVWRGRASGSDLGAGILIGIAAIAATIGLIAAAGAARIVPPTAGVAVWGPEGAGWLLGELQIAAAEELLFRATLVLVLRRWLGTIAAMALSAFLFVAVHNDSSANPIFALHLWIAGVTLAVALLRSGSIWLPIGSHAGWNWGCAMLFGAINSGQANGGHIFAFAGTGPLWLDGGTVGPEGSVFAWTGNIVELMLVLWWTRSKGKSS